jgi:hypothetical protein
MESLLYGSENRIIAIAKKHHKSPYNFNYCILTNYLNPVLDAFNFWHAQGFTLAQK